MKNVVVFLLCVFAFLGCVDDTAQTAAALCGPGDSSAGGATADAQPDVLYSPLDAPPDAPPDAAPLEADAPPPVRPSIVLYLADDLDQRGYDGTSRLKATLSAAGKTFTKFAIPVPLCCSFRVTMLRGQFAHNTGIWHNGGTNGGFASFHNSGKESDTVAVWLSAAGYETSLIGMKYLNGYPTVAAGPNFIPPGWTHWVAVNVGNEYAQYTYSLNVDGTTVPYGNTAADYGTDKITEYAVARIAATPPDRPFLMIITPTSPHSPATPPPRYQNAAATGVPRTGSFNEADVSDKPSWIQAWPLATSQEQTAADNLEKKRQRSMRAVEDSVDSVRAALADYAARSGVEPYFFFTSDNGFHQYQHRMPPGKGTAYEEDIRVPLIVVGPGVTPGSSSDALVGPIDLAPTWAEIAGASAPPFVDGRSLAPLLHGQTPGAWRTAMLLEHEDNEPPGSPPDGDDAPTFVGLRLPDATFVWYSDTNEGEYYDLLSDPFQLTNTYASLPPATAAAYLARATALRTATGAALRALEEGALP